MSGLSGGQTNSGNNVAAVSDGSNKHGNNGDYDNEGVDNLPGDDGGNNEDSFVDRNGQHHPIAEFLYQLTKMLTDDNSEIIEWTEGRIKVYYPDRLEGEVLHKYFRHSKFASFQRQLNYFGFRKIAGKGKMSPCSYVNEAATDDIRSLLLIKRKTNGTAARKAALQNRAMSMATGAINPAAAALGMAFPSLNNMGAAAGINAAAALNPSLAMLNASFNGINGQALTSAMAMLSENAMRAGLSNATFGTNGSLQPGNNNAAAAAAALTQMNALLALQQQQQLQQAFQSQQQPQQQQQLNLLNAMPQAQQNDSSHGSGSDHNVASPQDQQELLQQMQRQQQLSQAHQNLFNIFSQQMQNQGSTGHDSTQSSSRVQQQDSDGSSRPEPGHHQQSDSAELSQNFVNPNMFGSNGGSQPSLEQLQAQLVNSLASGGGTSNMNATAALKSFQQQQLQQQQQHQNGSSSSNNAATAALNAQHNPATAAMNAASAASQTTGSSLFDSAANLKSLLQEHSSGHGDGNARSTQPGATHASLYSRLPAASQIFPDMSTASFGNLLGSSNRLNSLLSLNSFMGSREPSLADFAAAQQANLTRFATTGVPPPFDPATFRAHHQHGHGGPG